MPAPTYLQLEEALQNAALQVETMSAIIGYLLPMSHPTTITADELRHNHDIFRVIVEPHNNGSITLSLKVKNEQ